MAPIGLKLGQNAFQTIPNISSFDSETQICFGFLLDHMIIWSYDHVIDEKIVLKNCFSVERSNVGDRLKRVLAKFEADRS